MRHLLKYFSCMLIYSTYKNIHKTISNTIQAYVSGLLRIAYKCRLWGSVGAEYYFTLYLHKIQCYGYKKNNT